MGEDGGGLWGTAGHGSGRRMTVGDGRAWVRMAGDCGGRPGKGQDGG